MTTQERKMFQQGRTADYINGFNAGLKEGARRERRALRRWLNAGLKRKLDGDSRVIHLEEFFLERNKLASRKRKGGK